MAVVDLNVEAIRQAMRDGEDAAEFINTLISNDRRIKGIEVVSGGSEFPEVKIEYHKPDDPMISTDALTGRMFFLQR